MRRLTHFNVLIVGLGLALLIAPLAFAEATITNIPSSQNELDTFNFLKASIDGDAGKVKSFLQSGVNVNITRTNGVTALMAACLYSRHDVIDVLLAAGADVNQQDKHGKKALDYAASRGHVETVEYLTVTHKIPDDNNYANYAKLMNMAYTDNQTDYFKEAQKIDYINRVGADGTTPLNNAAIYGNMKAIKKLIELGADINLRANHRYNSLTIELWKKHPEDKIFGNEKSLIGPLIDLYGDESPAEDGYTPIELAGMFNKPEVVRYLLERGAPINGQTGKQPPLILAIQTHSDEVIKLLIEKGADITLKDNRGVSAKLLALGSDTQDIKKMMESKDSTPAAKDEINNSLFKSVSSMGYWDPKDASMLKEALKLGADPNAHNDKGETPLEIAVKNALPDAVAILLEHGANPNVKDRSLLMEINQFFNATEASKLEVAKHLVEKGADVNATSAYGTTVLQALASSNLPKVVEYLIEHGAKVDAQDKDGRTALLRATEENKIENVKILLQHGADPNLKSPRYGSPFETAIHEKHLDIAQAMLDAIKPETAGSGLIIAAEEGLNDMVQKFIAKKVDLNTQNEGSMTAVIAAIDKNHPDTVKILLDAGANPNLADKGGYGSMNGETALCMASRKKSPEIVAMLLKAKANIDAHCDAVTGAAKAGSVEIVKLLADAGADMKDRFTGHWQALFVAAENGNTDIVRIMLDHGTPVDMRDEAYDTALMIAAGKGYLDIIRLLVERKADLEAVNSKQPVSDVGWHVPVGPPLMWATANHQQAAIDLLLSLGAKPLPKDMVIPPQMPPPPPPPF